MPTMNARLVSRTRPSGTIATAAATVPWSACCQLSTSSLPNSRINNSSEAGGMMNVSQWRIRLTPLRSSLSASLKIRASSASFAA